MFVGIVVGELPTSRVSSELERRDSGPRHSLEVLLHQLERVEHVHRHSPAARLAFRRAVEIELYALLANIRGRRSNGDANDLLREAGSAQFRC